MEKTFENFIVDHSNFFAHAMSKRVAEHPGEDYNPFIIIGDHGLGKSHLACAIKAEIEKEKGLRVLMRNCKDILDEWCIQMKYARMKDKCSDLLDWFRDYDVIILEDIHCLSDRPATQEYFADAFCRLALEGKQLVLTTSVRLANESMRHLYQWMNSKCGMWLLADLMKPQQHTRLRFLKQILKEMHWTLKMELQSEIVRRCVTRDQIESVVKELALSCVLLDHEINEADLDLVFRRRNL